MLRSRALALALVGLTALAGVAMTAPVAAADSTAATIIDLPDGQRAIPRGVWPIGHTDDGHTVFDAEQDPFSKSGGFTSHRIVSADKSVEDLDSSVESVVGDRLVASHNDTSVTSRLVTAPSWTTQTMPAGYTVMDYTADGIVVRSGSTGAHQLGLIAWGSNTVLGITGLPDGSSVYPYFHAVHGGSWSVLSAGFSGGGTGKLVVDTGARRAWPMQASAGDCPATGWSGLAVNEGVLAWYTQLADQTYVVCTTQLPASDDAQVAATTERPMTLLPPEVGYDYKLLPVGPDVLLSVADAKRTWGTEVGEPILAIAPDGTARELAHSGHGVIAGVTGHVLAVTGDQPGEASLRDVTVATDTSVEAMPIQPVGAWYTSIAVDGTTVVYSDDSAELGGVRRRTVDFDAGTAGPDTLLGSQVAGPVATGQGVAAWGTIGYQVWSTVMLADGTRISGSAYKPQWAEPGWVRFQGEVMRLPSGTRTSLADTAAFQDGVSYKPGGAVSGAAANAVVATDLVTGATSTITVPECTSVGDVQVAGSWLLVVCPVDATHLKSVVVDRTGTVATHVLGPSNSYYLGNGFALERGSGDSLLWASLSDAAVTWKTLGTATASGDEAPYSVAVSRGATPTAAWFSGRSAHVALLPVATSPLPSHPALAAPPAPTSLQVTIDPATGQATASWSWTAAAGAEQAQSFDVVAGDIQVDGLGASTRSTSIGAPPAGPRSVQVVVHGPTQTSTAQLDSVDFPGPPPVTPTMSSITPPVITGTPRVGSPLSASPGTWSPSDGSYAYQWFANGTAIAGATAATYTPTLAVLLKHLTVRVTATKANYNSTSALSASTAAVGLGQITNINLPLISGTKKAGRTLTASPGAWRPGSLTFRYTWLRDGRVITGAHDRTYKLTKASKGHQISVRVKAIRLGYATAVSTSHRTVKIR
jgi:hypothetical protein